MTISWITPAGSLGTVTERVSLDIAIEAKSNVGPITFTVLSGRLPRGLRLSQSVTSDSTVYRSAVQGSPTEVRKFTTNRFVIRASDGTDLEDRTFGISIDGDDAPQWVTKEGFLNVGLNNAYYVLDNSYVNFQLQVRDPDLIAGDAIEYYLIPNGGEMPPGLTLTSAGRINGFTDPVFALEYNDSRTGAYDSGTFDTMPLDLAAAETTGFDSFIYDLESFDYKLDTKAPRRLSRFYTFIVAASDGIHEVRRLFRIWVVTEEFLKSDNTFVQVDTNLFQADGDGTRKPIWITESNLGRVRANNYVTLFLEVYDPPSLAGTMTYFKMATNPGTYKLNSTGEIITNGYYELSQQLPEFRYTLRDQWSAAASYAVGDAVVYNDQTWVCQTGHGAVVDSSILFNSNSIYWNRDLASIALTFKAAYPAAWTVTQAETVSQFPPGTTIDTLTGEVVGRVPYQAAVTKNYKFTLEAVSFPPVLFEQNYNLRGDWSATGTYAVGDAVRYNSYIWVCIEANQFKTPTDGTFWDRGVSTLKKTFSVDIIGEIESAIEWITDSDLGTIPPNIASDKTLLANTLLYGGRTIYELITGQLPPGLELVSNGLIQGKVKQFADTAGPGLTRFYERTDSAEDSSTRSRLFNENFDQGDTSFDRTFAFNVKARDANNVAETVKTFTLTVATKTNVTFSNLYAKAFQSKDKRLYWYNFITDRSVFRESEVYRYGDPNFGIQPELKMLMYAGIESRDAERFVQAMSRNHYNKQVRFGNVKSAVAKDPVTQIPVYEIVYVEVVDEYEKDGKSISQTVQLSNSINSKLLVSYAGIKIDSDIPLVSDSDNQRAFPNSYKNMRKRIKGIGQRDREFLPLWMRSIQPDTYVETGWVKSVVLCYLKPGFAINVLTRIKNNSFEFNTLDFTIDRYVIDVIGGQFQDKYLAFSQRDILNKIASPVVDAFVPVSLSVLGSFDSDTVTFDSELATFDQG